MPKDHQTDDSIPAVAIIGMAGRFPGARTLEQYWHNLREGVESVSFFSDEELEASGIDPSVFKQPGYVRARALLEDAALFDASFFGYNPREAELIDPQQRVFLETAWEALEDAGYVPDTYKGSISVFAGMSRSTYFSNNLMSNPGFLEEIGGYQAVLSNDRDYLTTRVSYKLNLKGPSYDVQTACSTSLVAVQIAYESLLSFQSDLALAGGVSIGFPQKSGYLYKEGMILSPDGHCRPFDSKARGIVSGEGVGIVVLKRLSDALADGDSIHAVIRGAAINNDGSSKVGFTAPSVDGQAEVIVMAQTMAGVAPETIGYIEAHGTGTELGDPIEVAALTQAFRASTDRKQFCAIGSVKSNFGHLDVTAGVAGLIKTVLALERKTIPPSLHFDEPNPKIDFQGSPFFVPTKAIPWNRAGALRRAGVSSFGMGGTNVHVVVEEAPTPVDSKSNRRSQLILLSAKSSSALEAATKNLATALEKHPEVDFQDVAYTLQVGRKRFKHRGMLVSEGREDALKALGPRDRTRLITAVEDHADRPVVFMFSGQGSQYVNMALELYQVEASFREEVDHLCSLLKPHLGLDLRELLFPPKEQSAAATQQLTQTRFAQAALFVVEYALARLWMAWGVRPSAMIGHSIGEYVAACLAGVFSVEDGLGLVAERGALMQSMPAGSMLAVPMSENEVRPLLNSSVSLAAVNGPQLCVVSGPTPAVEAFHARLTQAGKPCTPLHTSHAFHSEMMEPILERFAHRVAGVKRNPPQSPFISNLTGTWITGIEATDPHYWAKHLRNTVRFSKGIQELLDDPDRVLLEVGPGTTLCSLARQQAKPPVRHLVLPSLRHPQEQRPDLAFLFNTLGRLWMSGVSVDWAGFNARERHRRIPLPTYPFERQRFWIEPQGKTVAGPSPADRLGKNLALAEWFYVPSWKRTATMRPNARERKSIPTIVLAFLDEQGLGARVTKRLEDNGCEVVAVEAGPAFHKGNENAFFINPASREDYVSLINELHASNKLPSLIAHFWTVVPKEHSHLSGIPCQRCQDLGFYSLLFLAQALEKKNSAMPADFAVISNDLQEVMGESILFPERATVLGPLRVIPQEYPPSRCRLIDVAFPGSESKSMESLTDQLVQELLQSPFSPVVAYRDQYRWVQIFEPIRLEKDVDIPSLLRDEGVYLITGGLGRIGYAIAEWMVRLVHARLILTGRTPLPEKNGWSEWLSQHDEKDPVSQRIRKLKALEGLGAEVVAMCADVGSEEQMENVRRSACQGFGTIHGVIHASGVTEGHSIHDIDQPDCEAQFHAKVRGLQVLRKVFHETPVDFFLLTSSLSSVLGGLGFVAYTAANAYMDSFAQVQNQKEGPRWITVNWDGWDLGEKLSERGSAGSGRPTLTLSAQEGVESLKRIFSAGSLTHFVVSCGDLPARISQWIAMERREGAEVRMEPRTDPTHSRPNLSAEYVAPRDESEKTIANLWESLLGINGVGIHDDFFELGGHSLLATQVISRIRDIFHVNLPLQNMFDKPTVAGLAQTLSSLLDRGEQGAVPKIEILKPSEATLPGLPDLEKSSDEEVESMLADLLTRKDE